MEIFELLETLEDIIEKSRNVQRRNVRLDKGNKIKTSR